MKVLVTGASGQLGHDVVKVLGERGFAVLAPSHAEMDITDRASVDSYFDTFEPDAVMHCAAYTAVDRAEDEPELCRKVNVEGTRNLAENCARSDIPMMYVSTDYVFDGTGDGFWEVGDPTNPINVYGLSKRDGENEVLKLSKHYVIRISWVFGINGNNFVKTMIRLSQTRDEINVVDDQCGSPTYTPDLAVLMADMVVSEKYGIYHARNEGVCTWYGFAKEIFRFAGSEIKVNPITSDQYPMKARRPMNSRLSVSSLKDAGFNMLPDWHDSLARFMNQL